VSTSRHHVSWMRQHHHHLHHYHHDVTTRDDSGRFNNQPLCALLNPATSIPGCAESCSLSHLSTASRPSQHHHRHTLTRDKSDKFNNQPLCALLNPAINTPVVCLHHRHSFQLHCLHMQTVWKAIRCLTVAIAWIARKFRLCKTFCLREGPALWDCLTWTTWKMTHRQDLLSVLVWSSSVDWELGHEIGKRDGYLR
jgi:hypothetical protein